MTGPTEETTAKSPKSDPLGRPRARTPETSIDSGTSQSPGCPWTRPNSHAMAALDLAGFDDVGKLAFRCSSVAS